MEKSSVLYLRVFIEWRIFSRLQQQELNVAKK